MRTLAIGLAAASLLAAGQAQAADAAGAQLSGVTGSVLVSRDGKLQPVKGSTGLRVGDRVIAKDGQAQVRYADGCVATLKRGAMATIAAASPCVAGQGVVSVGGDAAQLSNIPQPVLVIGGTLLAFGIIASIDTEDDQPPPPVSP